MMIGNLLYKLYGVKVPVVDYQYKRIIWKIIYKLEGGGLYSKTLRRIMKDHHNVEIGKYSYEGCFNPTLIEPFTKIGRYCSIARCVRIITINHPMEVKSTSVLFWHPESKFYKEDLCRWSPITIENDVWIGHGAIILPNVTHIGNGATIAAGAVLNKNVPPYAVVVGNPARIVRYRFTKEIIDELLASRWWEKDIDELGLNIEEFQKPYKELYAERKAAAGGKGQSDEQSDPAR